MSKYIRILDDDPFEFIRAHSGMYLPPGSASLGEKLVVLLVLNCLTLNVASLRIERVEDWYLVGSSVEWLKIGSGAEQGIHALFHRIQAMPEAGANSVRSEVVVAAFSRDLTVWLDGNVDSICSSTASAADADLIKRLRSNEFGPCAVLFRPADRSPVDNQP